MAVALIRGDAAALPLPDNSVDLIVTSPPYWALRSYTDGGAHYAGQIGSEATPADYIDNLMRCTREWMRVIKPTGSIFVNLGDKYNSAASGQNLRDAAGKDGRGTKHYAGERGSAASAIPKKSLMLLPERYRIAAVDRLSLIARAVIIWDKPNGLPESVTDRVRRSHEDWVHLAVSPRYYAAVDAIREAHTSVHSPRARSGAAFGATRTDTADGAQHLYGHPLGKLPGSVWRIATQPLKVPAPLGIDHYAAYPMEWPRRIIQGWSPGNGLVLDPFGGTGTTALVAHALGRHGISVDMSADYCRLAAWRTTDPTQLARASRPAGAKPAPARRPSPTEIRPARPAWDQPFPIFDGEIRA